METPRALTVKEFSEHVNISADTIRRRLVDGSLRGVKIAQGRWSQWRIPYSELTRFYEHGWREPAKKEE